MISFESDYIAGAHPEVLEALAQTNMEPMPGYGSDEYCAMARAKIRKACGCAQADVHFLVGGTQTNQTIISSMLRSFEGVVAADTGHVSAHEAGAIEYTGHKVLTIPQREGKIVAEDLLAYLEGFYADENHEHLVFPGMVYISHPTEYGTLYAKEELEAIRRICNQYQLPLFMDGARLGYGLMSKHSDVTLVDVAHLCDVFYIGGTKVGALCGEAVVFTHNNTPAHFLTQVKQQGALLAKGRLLGVQFDALFTDDLYFRISAHAIRMAERLKQILKEKGYAFYLESPTNQQFVLLEDAQLDRLRGKVAYSFWEKPDAGHTVIRLATSWATTEEDMAELEHIL